MCGHCDAGRFGRIRRRIPGCGIRVGQLEYSWFRRAWSWCRLSTVAWLRVKETQQTTIYSNTITAQLSSRNSNVQPVTGRHCAALQGPDRSSVT
eukprot:524144-Prymnesium_polylepis.1